MDDLICELEREDCCEVLRPGVTLNRRRRTAEEQRLYFLETSPANRHIHGLGGSKSAGLGWLTWKGLETLPQDDPAWAMLLAGAVL